MQSPEKIYEQLKHIDNIKDVAYERLFTNLLTLNLRGTAKLIEIDSTDQESLIKIFNSGRPVPGMIYTFWYLQKENIVLLEQGKQHDFVDFAPIMFCTSITQKSFSGINLNMLPPSERLKFFMQYYQLYKEFFEDVEELSENNKIAINKKFVVRSLMGKTQDMIKSFSKKTNAFFNYGYRKYNYANVKQLRMLEFEEYGYIVFYEPRNAFKKINFKQIYDIYYRQK